MNIKEVMTRDPEYLHLETTVLEAARRMRDLDVGMLPIGDGSRLKGMLTDRDITVRVTAENRDPSGTAVEDVMTEEVLYAYEDQDVTDAARMMEEKQIRRLVVLNRNKHMTGVLALGDLRQEREGNGDSRSRGGFSLRPVPSPQEKPFGIALSAALKPADRARPRGDRSSRLRPASDWMPCQALRFPLLGGRAAF